MVFLSWVMIRENIKKLRREGREVLRWKSVGRINIGEFFEIDRKGEVMGKDKVYLRGLFKKLLFDVYSL